MTDMEPISALAPVEVGDLADWIEGIDFALWPQQHRLEDGGIRPAMVTDLAWHGFGVMTEPVVQECLEHFPYCTDRERMLTVVMPGHSIPPHTDRQSERWRCRIHIPLLTNEDAALVVEGVSYTLEVGQAYLFDTRREHAVVNDGDTPRVHFVFDVVQP